MITRIIEGNHYDSRLPGHSYTFYTTGYDVCITDDGIEYYYRLRNYDGDEVCSCKPVEIKAPKELTWEQLDEDIKKCHFWVCHPGGSEAEMNLFVYGEVKGKKINAEIEWADAHLVRNRDITRALIKKLGFFEKVEFLKSVSRWTGTGYRDNLYVLDDKWLVTVHCNEYTGSGFVDTFEFSDYQEVRNREKEFGRRASKLAKITEVPWKIAVMAGHIEDDDEAIEVLRKIRRARTAFLKDPDPDYLIELDCGYERRNAAINALLEEEVLRQLDCTSQKRTRDLAMYMAGRDLK